MKTRRIIKNGKMVGYLIAFKDVDTNRVHIGHSLCAKEDMFDKWKARDIAFERAEVSWDRVTKVPQSILIDYLTFYKQCVKYFKDAEFFDEVRTYDAYDGDYVYESIEELIEAYAINN